MNNFNFNRANINTQSRKHRIKKTKKNNQEYEINAIIPIIQEYEINTSIPIIQEYEINTIIPIIQEYEINPIIKNLKLI